ncbi:diguanylate cyclase (GGDEF)-like protein [Fibrobacter sp. UWR4]|nr:diguanylate cyclase (GGDEF)-like protein [Fibrobacter sp. UWR4]PZW72289.1 diguanylate cyclase (GGDEF)-like protein [Fibrobacter sp. UWR1]
MQKNLLRNLSEHRTVIFLMMCLCVHVFNIFFFGKIGLFPLAVLNGVSSCLYVIFILFMRKSENLRISFAYFEIIIFSALSELTSGGHFGYLNFVIGMVAVIFFLLPSENRKKYVYQFIGAICAVAISQISIYNFSFHPELMDTVLEYKSLVNSINLVITLFTLFYLSNLYLVELRTTREKLDYTSNHDMLTGLYNRRFFEGIMKRSKEEKERSFSVAMLDVDDFKKINDTYGHETGDRVLSAVSKCIESCLPSNAVAVRWGGEEFVLYLPQIDNSHALDILSSFRAKLADQVIYHKDTRIAITVTIGLCTGENIAEYEDYIRQADEKLYWGKKHGKNQIVK